jgi:hypothetical protein
MTYYSMHDPEIWGSWLANGEAMRESHPDSVDFFAAIEVDDRGIEPFHPLTDRLSQLNGSWWTYSLNDGRTEVHTLSRLRHITAGQNLASEYATAAGATHMLFMAADCEPPADVLPRLLEAESELQSVTGKPVLIGPEIPTYCLTGKPIEGLSFPCQEQLISVAAILIPREVFKRLRWRADGEMGMSDDPCYRLDAQELLGARSFVHKDVVARHKPESIGPIETRYAGVDMSVQHAN